MTIAAAPLADKPIAWVYIPASGSTTWTFTVSGGIAFSSTAINILKDKAYSPSGGIAFAGTAVPLHNKILVPTGGLSFSGSASEIKTYMFVPGGVITFSGSVPTTFVPFGSAEYNTYLPLTGVGH